MADVQWSNLPPDILSVLTKILNTDVDRIRLRSICSSWRASIHPRLRPMSIPLKLPPFNFDSTSPDGSNLFLSFATLLYLSRPKHGPYAGDPSDGWLFRVLEVSPNLFSVLVPFFPKTCDYPPGTAPKGLNLLDYRVSEICQNYCLMSYDGYHQALPPWPLVKKVLVLRNYAVGCEFAVLALFMDWRMSYLKYGDKEWTLIDTNSHLITDVAVCKGKCYAISGEGVLLSLDSSFNLLEADFPHLPADSSGFDSHLVEYKSDLYAFMKVVDLPGELGGDEGNNRSEIPLRLEIFKKCDNWKRVECLGNDTLFSCDDYSFGFSVENFKGLKGNCVYMAHSDPSYSHCYGRKYLYGVYDFDKGKTSIMNYAQDQTLLYWPIPEWIMSSS